ncbi:MAG: hypothetical protein LBR78_02020 [Holosporales bacterium]|jgi:hypothetical protein|nr:hypothetical protein [Holosporales bacterium]
MSTTLTPSESKEWNQQWAASNRKRIDDVERKSIESIEAMKLEKDGLSRVVRDVLAEHVGEIPAGMFFAFVSWIYVAVIEAELHMFFEDTWYKRVAVTEAYVRKVGRAIAEAKRNTPRIIEESRNKLTRLLPIIESIDEDLNQLQQYSADDEAVMVTAYQLAKRYG